MAKCLVTGGTGFIGSYLTRRLYQMGHEVTIIARHPITPWYQIPRAAKILAADLSNKASLAGLDGNYDYVFHTAVSRDSAGKNKCYRTNVLGTRNLLELLSLKSPGLKKFIHISSLGAAGFSNNGTPKKETDPTKPASFYGRTKLLAEEEVIGFKDRIPYIILRPCKVYGPGDKKILLHFKLVKHGLVPEIGLKHRYMSLCYVEDLVGAVISAAQSDITNNMYFISDGNVYSWEIFYNTIANALNLKLRTLFIPQKLMQASMALLKLPVRLPFLPFPIEPTTIVELESKYWTCDPEKFSKDFSYCLNTSIKEGFKRTAEWFFEKKLL